MEINEVLCCEGVKSPFDSFDFLTGLRCAFDS